MSLGSQLNSTACAHKAQHVRLYVHCTRYQCRPNLRRTWITSISEPNRKPYGVKMVLRIIRAANHFSTKPPLPVAAAEGNTDFTTTRQSTTVGTFYTFSLMVSASMYGDRISISYSSHGPHIQHWSYHQRQEAHRDSFRKQQHNS